VGRLAVPGVRLEPVLDHLTGAGLLRKTRKRAYVLTRDSCSISVAEIIDAVRGGSEAGLGRRAAELLHRARAARIEAFDGATLADLAGDTPESGEAGDES